MSKLRELHRWFGSSEMEAMIADGWTISEMEEQMQDEIIASENARIERERFHPDDAVIYC